MCLYILSPVLLNSLTLCRSDRSHQPSAWRLQVWTHLRPGIPCSAHRRAAHQDRDSEFSYKPDHVFDGEFNRLSQWKLIMVYFHACTVCLDSWFLGNGLLFIDLCTVTYQELFVRLVPYHCLGSLWSQRDKKGREGVCWSVRATVRQFNKLANAVLASCLWPTKLRSQQRAVLLEKWISVAEVSMQKALKMQDLMPFLQAFFQGLMVKWQQYCSQLGFQVLQNPQVCIFLQ